MMKDRFLIFWGFCSRVRQILLSLYFGENFNYVLKNDYATTIIINNFKFFNIIIQISVDISAQVEFLCAKLIYS